MVIRQEFENELESIHKHVVKMGAFIEESIDDTIEALINQNATLAKEVIERDTIIDKLEKTIEKEAILITAKQQPVATDLRNIASVMKIITDLERIADHCADISQYTIKLSEEKYVRPLIDIPQMAHKVKLMVRNVIDSYINKDVNLAKEIIKQDDEIDKYFYVIVEELTEIIKKKPEVASQCISFIFIVKYLERMADHATNVAEWIEYIVTGKL